VVISQSNLILVTSTTLMTNHTCSYERSSRNHDNHVMTRYITYLWNWFQQRWLLKRCYVIILW